MASTETSTSPVPGGPGGHHPQPQGPQHYYDGNQHSTNYPQSMPPPPSQSPSLAAPGSPMGPTHPQVITNFDVYLDHSKMNFTVI
jgi:hypothetical protein